MKSFKIDNTILIATIGSDETLLALYTENGGDYLKISEANFQNKRYCGIETIVACFLGNYKGVPKSMVCVIAATSKYDCTPCTVNKTTLKAQSSQTTTVQEMSAFEAMANIFPNWTKKEVTTLYGTDENAFKKPDSYVIVSPSARQGYQVMVKEAEGYRMSKAHLDEINFHPQSPLEFELFNFLDKKYGKVENEQIFSECGVSNILEFLMEAKGERVYHETLKRMFGPKKCTVVTEMALTQKDPVCERALDIFATIFGRYLRMLALVFAPEGGLLISDEFSPKIKKIMKRKAFASGYFGTGLPLIHTDQIGIKILYSKKAIVKGALMQANHTIKEKENYPYSFHPASLEFVGQAS